jgi:hypothetical protein
MASGSSVTGHCRSGTASHGGMESVASSNFRVEIRLCYCFVHKPFSLTHISYLQLVTQLVLVIEDLQKTTDIFCLLAPCFYLLVYNIISCAFGC